MGHYFSESDAIEIVNTIDDIEEKTSGEIRVHIEDLCDKDPMKRAVEVFHKLNMDNTKDRTGVLLYLAIEDKKIAIIGDEGINKLVSEDYWESVIDSMKPFLKNMDIVNALKCGLDKVGNKLIENFPNTREYINELPNEISYGNK